MKEYLRIVQKILQQGVSKRSRTEDSTYAIFGERFEHDMSTGFPLITTKKIPLRLVSSELEFFIGGHTDKQWLQEHRNHIWDEWCNPTTVPYGHDAETKERMQKERDLGPIYGFQWRRFNAPYQGPEADYSNQGKDQLAKIVDALKTNPYDRGLVVSAWNPAQLDEMALRPCHYAFQVDVIGDTLNLGWCQRTVDVMLGLPFNIASYGLLLHLLAKEGGFKEGKLIGFLGDTHIYDKPDHLTGAREQLTRQPYPLPQLQTDFTSIFKWKHTDTMVVNYQSHPPIKMEVAV